MSNASVYEELRAAIASGNIRPHEPLIESDLMERFDAGRPAVRIALVRLEQEGLVEQQRNRSARVRMVERKEALEIYRARALLESYAAARAAENATGEDVEVLRGLIEAIKTTRAAADLSGAAALDTQLHEKILEIADDSTISRLHRGLHGHLVRYHHRTRLEQEHSRSSLTEHETIVDAIAAGDAEASGAAMRTHLDHLTETLSSVLLPD